MTKDWKELDKEKTRGRKRYLERLQETREANKEMEDALDELVKISEELGLYDLPPVTRKDNG